VLNSKSKALSLFPMAFPLTIAIDEKPWDFLSSGEYLNFVNMHGRRAHSSSSPHGKPKEDVTPVTGSVSNTRAVAATTIEEPFILADSVFTPPSALSPEPLEGQMRMKRARFACSRCRREKRECSGNSHNCSSEFLENIAASNLAVTEKRLRCERPGGADKARENIPYESFPTPLGFPKGCDTDAASVVAPLRRVRTPLLPASAAPFASRRPATVVLGSKVEPWLTQTLKRINKIGRPLNSVPQRKQFLTDTLSSPNATWILASLLLPKALKSELRKDADTRVEALSNYQMIHLEAYIVHVDLRNEVIYKLTPETIECLIVYHKSIHCVDARANTYDWSEKEQQCKNLHKDFIQAINGFVFRTHVSALEGLEEGGAGELLECEGVKNDIMSLFKPLAPPRPHHVAIWSQASDTMAGLSEPLEILSVFPGIMHPPADFESSTWDTAVLGFLLPNCMTGGTAPTTIWNPEYDLDQLLAAQDGEACKDHMTTNNIYNN
jgi:hypothetical protein